MKTLKQVKVGDTVTVVKLHGEGAVKRRIMDMGLTKGIPLTHRRTATELLRLSHQADQRESLAYLVKNLPGGVGKLTRALLRMKPRAAAHTLLDILDMRLKADPRTPYPAER